MYVRGVFQRPRNLQQDYTPNRLTVSKIAATENFGKLI